MACILSDLSLMLLIYHIVKNLISLEQLLSMLMLSDIALRNRTDGMPVLFLYKKMFNISHSVIIMIFFHAKFSMQGPITN